LKNDAAKKGRSSRQEILPVEYQQPTGELRERAIADTEIARAIAGQKK
jgi:hypothetical protein